MYLILALVLAAPFAQTQQKSDSTQISLLRYQLQEQARTGTAQAAKIVRLEAEVDSLARKVDNWNGKIQFLTWAGSLIAVIMTILGVGGLIAFIKHNARKLQAKVDKAIYRISPLDMPIKLPNEGMEKQLQRLRKIEFTNITTYPWLDDNCTRDAVVVLATNDKEAKALKQHIENKQLGERENVVFVVYTKGAEIDRKLLNEFDNVTFANNHLTLVQALFVAARGLVR